LNWNFLNRAATAVLPRKSWQARIIFEDSPTCMNFNSNDHEPCSECLLIPFVPKSAREEQTPCIKIPLSPSGVTLEVLDRTGTQKEIEAGLGAWVRATTRRLEAEKTS